MRLVIPDEYSREDTEREINRIINDLVGRIGASKILDVITTDGVEPPDVDEKKIFLHRDGTTKKLIIRDEGENYTIDLTKVT